jgi:proline dehydrogenase
MRVWQRGMIALACSDKIRGLMQRGRFTTLLARRFVAGDSRAEASQTIAALRERGLAASLYYLGEYVTSPPLVERNVEQVLALVEEPQPWAAATVLSVDPTQIGFSISDELGWRNALRIGRTLRDRRTFQLMMIDMEDRSLVERSILLHERLREEGVPVAITLQAYLRRTEEDAERLAQRGAAIRLCKGAFVAPREVAWPGPRSVSEAYLRLSRKLLSPAMKEAGGHPIFATHDDRLIEAILRESERCGWSSGEIEFELLLGVREGLQRRLREAGQKVRVYVPFGSEWWPYTARRIGENAANARFVLRAVLGR